MGLASLQYVDWRLLVISHSRTTLGSDLSSPITAFDGDISSLLLIARADAGVNVAGKHQR